MIRPSKKKTKKAFEKKNLVREMKGRVVEEEEGNRERGCELRSQLKYEQISDQLNETVIRRCGRAPALRFRFDFRLNYSN